MSGREQLTHLLGALVLDPPAYGWLGECFRIVPYPGEEEGAFPRALALRLYADWYTSGAVAPATPPVPGAEMLKPPRRAGLSSANHGRGARQDGWRMRDRLDGRVLVERDGLSIWADESRVHPVETDGDRVEVVMPSASLAPPGGFCVMFGDAGAETISAEPVDRFYWNVSAEGRSALVAAVTGRLNALALPFRFKVMSDPDAVRCDAGVLYTPRSVRRQVSESLEAIAAAISGHLGRRTPTLTAALAPGVGFAEDPPGEESFGTDRCALLAEGLLGASGAGATSASDRMTFIGERLAREGISLDTPHLNRGSDPEDDPPIFAW